MWHCPVCNAYTDLAIGCPECSGTMEDMGKISDYYTPYSPYREIDDAKLTNEYHEFNKHECMHYMCCPSCGYELIQSIQEEEYVSAFFH